jgi:hypothetical protein
MLIQHSVSCWPAAPSLTLTSVALAAADYTVRTSVTTPPSRQASSHIRATFDIRDPDDDAQTANTNTTMFRHESRPGVDSHSGAPHTAPQGVHFPFRLHTWNLSGSSLLHCSLISIASSIHIQIRVCGTSLISLRPHAPQHPSQAMTRARQGGTRINQVAHIGTR